MDKAQTAFHYTLPVPPGSRQGVMMHGPKRVWLDFEPGCSFRVGNWNLISPQVGECYMESEETWCTPNVSVHCTLTWNYSCPLKLQDICLHCLSRQHLQSRGLFYSNEHRLKRWLLQDVAVVWSKAAVMKIVLLLIRAVTTGNHSSLI